MKLSVVVPFYNEEGNIRLVLEAFKSLNEKRALELVCVNNGSTDGSRGIFDELLQKKEYSFARLVYVERNIGYGHGILQGIQEASGDILAWTHADLQTDPEDVARALDSYLEESDENVVVKGNRIKRSLSQVLLSFGMASLASIVLGKSLFEINAQPKLFHRNFLRHMNKAPLDSSLDLFFLYQAKSHGYRVKTIDVYFKERIHGESKWAFSFKSKVKTILRTVRYIFRLAR